MEKKKERNPNIKRVKKHFEFMGFHILLCDGDLKEVFDILAVSIYPGTGIEILIKVQVDNVSRTVEKAVRGFKTHMAKEIWLIRFGEKEKHPGIIHVYRFSGSELIQEARDLSLKDALEKAVKSAKSKS